MSTADTFRDAFDQIGDGIVLLDSARRAVFINRTFRRLWRLTDSAADSGPALADLIRHGREIDGFHTAPADRNADAMAVLAEAIGGELRAADIRRRDGSVLRFSSAPLAGGGLMLRFSDVTEAARAEESMRRLAFHDHLTGVLNRRGLVEAGQREVARSLRRGSPLSVLILDADDFKQINDSHGHDIGDKVLVAIAATCRAAARTSDAVGRMGGEEFALILPDTQIEGGMILAERLRARLAEAQDGLPRVTASLGVAGGVRANDSFEEMLKRADDALYRAKREGRNRVCAEAA